MTARQRNVAMARLYAQWRREDASLPPTSSRRRGYQALADLFRVSVHVARHAVAYAR